jgi:hypothetical protein
VAVWYSGGADAEYGSSTDVFGCTSFVAIDKLFLMRSSFSSSLEETTSSSFELAMTTKEQRLFNFKTTLFPSVLDKRNAEEISDDDFLSRLLRASCCCFEKVLL